MKTFLWTSLFWIFAAFVCVFGLGYCNMPFAPFISNNWLASITPNNIRQEIASKYNEEYQIDYDFEEICKNLVEEEKVEEPEEIVNEKSQKNEEIVETENKENDVDLSVIIENQHVIYWKIVENYENIIKTLVEIKTSCSNTWRNDVSVVDEKMKKKLELEYQIQELQDQLNLL